MKRPKNGKARGERIVYNTRVYLRHGGGVPLNELQVKQLPLERP